MTQFDPDAVRAFEHTGWEKAAPAYGDTFAAASGEYADALLDAADIRPGFQVLDLCCGPGLVTGAAARRGAAASGLDFSPAMLTEARAAYPGLCFHEGDAEAVPLADASFDAVVSNFGIHHVPRPERALAEVFRVLRPGGRFAFTNWANPADNIAWQLLFDAVRLHGDPGAAKAPPSGGGLDSEEAVLAPAARCRVCRVERHADPARMAHGASRRSDRGVSPRHGAHRGIDRGAASGGAAGDRGGDRASRRAPIAAMAGIPSRSPRSSGAASSRDDPPRNRRADRRRRRGRHVRGVLGGPLRGASGPAARQEPRRPRRRDDHGADDGSRRARRGKRRRLAPAHRRHARRRPRPVRRVVGGDPVRRRRRRASARWATGRSAGRGATAAVSPRSPRRAIRGRAAAMSISSTPDRRWRRPCGARSAASRRSAGSATSASPTSSLPTARRSARSRSTPAPARR